MRKKYSSLYVSGFIIVLAIGLALFVSLQPSASKWNEDAIELSENSVKTKKARSEYFFRLLRNPATNSIPKNIRSRELQHARHIPGRNGGFLQKTAQGNQQTLDVSWQLAGPAELGGRTRALAIDQRDSDVILAGGVSGGVWKSTDGGNTWQLKTDPNQSMSVTWLEQDPTNLDTWYYVTGEFSNNTASDRGYTAFYYGTGIYKSTDNGENWSVLPATEDNDTRFSSRYDYMTKIEVSPTTGSIFAASNAIGLLRSTDDGNSFPIVKGGINKHLWTDFDIDQQGNIVTVLSSENFESGGSPGIFYSTDDGASWTDITPNGFPTSHGRSVITFAPSDPSIVYVFTEKIGSSTNQGVSFFKIDISDPQNPAPEDRSSNLPDFGGEVGGVNLQGGYNMVVSVKPDDPDFVMIGGTNLFRSRDGFASKPTGGYDNTSSTQKDEYWIGGYAKNNNISQYQGHHPDQHVITYDPNNPNKVWSGHDGGLSATSDITTSSVTWQDKDEGYVTGQFYTVDLGPRDGDKRIVGGTQDNGSPYFTFDDQNMQQTTADDISSGDGAYAHIGNNYIYTSSQNGRVLRWSANLSSLSFVEPLNATNQLFIHPYAVDPNDDGIMYYPAGDRMWRNTTVDEIDNRSNPDGTTQGWESFTAVSATGFTISTLEVTSARPADRLYYAAYSSSQVPKIFYIDDASTSQTITDISISNAPSGAYVHDIAVNPYNGDEVIAVMSNYNIVGLYHSSDGGQNWTAIEGNLKDDAQQPGPSIRSATILPTSSGTLYVVGTSTGVYSATSLSGSSTSWTRESDDGSVGSIGYSVAEFITSRPIDGRIAVGTHGRGIFLGQTNTGGFALPGFTQTLTVDNSWQLIGSPMKSSEDVTVGSDITMYSFSGRYRSASELESQKGYWVKSRSGSQIEFDGEADTTATIPLEKGWNIIGGTADTVSVSALKDPNGIRSPANIFEYIDGSYQAATEIKPTGGYWVHANSSGNVELSTAGSSSNKIIAKQTQPVDVIRFSRGNSVQQFFISRSLLKHSERNRYRMPPQGPSPELDVRTDDGFRIAGDKSTELQLTTSGYPVRASISSQANSSYVLKGVTGADTLYYSLKPGNDVVLQRPHQKLFLVKGAKSAIITEHDLMPNYPNPFNPSTQIPYQIASQAKVTLEVYNVLGQKVQTLVNQEQAPGSYTVQFDGSNLSSGMYFIQLKAGSKSKIQKMTLLK